MPAEDDIIDELMEENADLTLRLDSAKLYIKELEERLSKYEPVRVGHRDEYFAHDHLASSNT